MAPTDGALVRRAKDAAARLAEAERQVQVARGDYHTMIRRLHLGGASLREIAEALEMSHQRAQQIVRGAGGTWWRRVWSTRTAKRDAVCTFCERPPSEVAKLVADPHVYICDGCIQQGERSLGADAAAPGDAFPLRRGKRATRCSFCSKRRSPARPVVCGCEAAVRAECLALARQIIADRRDAG